MTCENNRKIRSLGQRLDQRRALFQCRCWLLDFRATSTSGVLGGVWDCRSRGHCPMKLSKRLLELIEGFRTINPSYGVHESAKGCCTEASHAFHNLLVDAGVLQPPKGSKLKQAEWFEGCTWDIVLDDDHDRHMCPEWYP